MAKVGNNSTVIAGISILASPSNRSDRTPQQVFRDHLDAINSSDVERIGQDYLPDAFLILTHEKEAIQGLNGIKSFFRGFLAMTGDAAEIEIKSLSVYGKLITVEWVLKSPNLIVGDGVETFIVDSGFIAAQSGRMGDLLVS